MGTAEIKTNKQYLVPRVSKQINSTSYPACLAHAVICKSSSVAVRRRQTNFYIMGGGKGVLNAMHGRSPMAIDPRIPTILRRSRSGFHRPGGYLGYSFDARLGCWAKMIMHPFRASAFPPSEKKHLQKLCTIDKLSRVCQEYYSKGFVHLVSSCLVFSWPPSIF